MKFDWRKIDLETIVRTPVSLYRMISVAWNLQSNRRQLMAECEKELGRFLHENVRQPYQAELFSNWTDADLMAEVQTQAKHFADSDTYWPFILVMMAESTLQALQTALISPWRESARDVS